MGKCKPRHNNENQMSKPCNKENTHWIDSNGRIWCSCYDGTYTKNDGTVHTILENSDVWCDPDGENGCKCNPFLCTKMRLKWFASLSNRKQNIINEGKVKFYDSCITRRSK